jgi:hypothetical protein
MTVVGDEARVDTVRDAADYWCCAGGGLHAFESDPSAYAT